MATPPRENGCIGLANLGNTCFLNSCIQVLNHTYELVQVLKTPTVLKSFKNTRDTEVLQEWLALRDVMWSYNTGGISPNKFVALVQQCAAEKNRDLFTGRNPNDMPEFLFFMIECMHESISRGIHMNIHGSPENEMDICALECFHMLRKTYEKEYSEIMALFYGIQMTEIRSADGAIKHSLKPEMFFILDLPIPTAFAANHECTLYDCFDAYTQSEIMSGDNAWFNEKTGQKETIQKRMTFWNFSNILVITLNRFGHDGESKMQHLVRFPLTELNLAKYVSGYASHEYIYDLYGVCNHFGNLHGGHYTCFVQNEKQEWLHFNDLHVDVMPSDPNALANIVISPMAYCLFYRKRPPSR